MVSYYFIIIHKCYHIPYQKYVSKYIPYKTNKTNSLETFGNIHERTKRTIWKHLETFSFMVWLQFNVTNKQLIYGKIIIYDKITYYKKGQKGRIVNIHERTIWQYL